MADCKHLGEATGETVPCSTCPGRVELKLHRCGVYGQCTLRKPVEKTACCNGTNDADGSRQPCLGREEPTMTIDQRRRPGMQWACGLTTVPERRTDLLPRTIASLRAAGFDQLRLFVDGAKDGAEWERAHGFETTTRHPKIRAFGNWCLGLAELWIRNPNAHRYAMFQDDFVTYRNLKGYLEKCELAEKTYWNLYTFPHNSFPLHDRALRGSQTGWYPSKQNGRGGVALVFTRRGVIDLLSSLNMIERPMDPDRGHRNLDGGVVNSLVGREGKGDGKGYVELVHHPSLVQHEGRFTTIEKNRPHKQATEWMGEGWDAMEMLKK